MFNSTLEIILKARDEASQVITGMSGKLKDLEPQFKTMAVAGTAAFAAISAIGVKAISDYSEAEKSAAQLKHAVVDVTGATEEQLKATNDLADALEKKGVLDGDNIKMGLAQLSTFGLSNEAVRKLGGSLADLAVNQFGVSASGEQLSDTANMIAKALNGQFGVLEKSGVRFTDAQKDMIKFGSEMEKVDAINQGFAQNLKYTNDVALTTTEGQLAKAKVAAGNLSEELGKTLVPIVQELTKALVPILQKIQEWIAEHPTLTRYIVLGGLAIGGLVAALGTLGLILPTIINVLGFLSTAVRAVGIALEFASANPIVLIIAGIVALIAAIIWLITHWDLVKAKTIEIWTKISEFFKTIWEGIKKVFKEAIDWIIGLFQPLIDIVQRVIDMIENVGNKIKSIGGSIQSAAQSITGNSGAYNPSGAGGGLATQAWNAITGKKAQGGNVVAGSSYLVGENGPEMFTPNNSGNITPNNKLGGQGGGYVINITGTFLSDDAAEKVGDMIIQKLKRVSRVGL